MKRIQIFLVLLILPLSDLSYAQINDEGKLNNLTTRQIDRYNSEKQIRRLKKGALLIRLKTKAPLINALRERDRNEEADHFQELQRKANQEIIAAFNTYFDFCPTYFFYSHYSDQIEKNLLDSIVFVDENGLESTAIQPKEKYYLMAEFTHVTGDTSTFATDSYLSRGENGLERRTRYEGGGNTGFEALVFKSLQLYQLRRPFPYYARTLQSLPIFRRSYAKVVRNANENLHYYYNKVN